MKNLCLRNNNLYSIYFFFVKFVAFFLEIHRTFEMFSVLFFHILEQVHRILNNQFFLEFLFISYTRYQKHYEESNELS